MSENHVIGINNQLPWRLPADLKHFKALTTGHPIVMGRKTYEAIGRPLPNRTNIILTRNSHFAAEGCIVVTSMNEAIQSASEIDSTQIFIIGGADIYLQSMPLLSRIYLTIVHQTLVGDAYFPKWHTEDWEESDKEIHQADEANQYAYSFITMERIHKADINSLP